VEYPADLLVLCVRFEPVASINTPRLLFVSEGDFIFSAKVSAKFGETPYDGGALIVYADSKNGGKLLFEHFKSRKIGMAATVSKGSGGDAYHGTRDNNHQFLARRIVQFVCACFNT
jgi:regulation of enolase protein 1 (concanavalin A-like superfamily)